MPLAQSNFKCQILEFKTQIFWHDKTQLQWQTLNRRFQIRTEVNSVLGQIFGHLKQMQPVQIDICTVDV